MDMRDIDNMTRMELNDEAMQRPGTMFTLFIDEAPDGPIQMGHNFDSLEEVVEALEETILQIQENIGKERFAIPPKIDMLTKVELASILIERGEQNHKPVLIVYEEDESTRKRLMHSFEGVQSISQLLRDLADYFENATLDTNLD